MTLEAIKNFVTDPVVIAAATPFLVVAIDYVVKRSKNKIDDAIWSRIKGRIVNGGTRK